MSLRVKLAVASIISGVVGILIGVGFTFWFTTQFALSGLVSSYRAGIVTKVSVLKNLRQNKSDSATQLLEILLDGDIIGLTPFLSADNPHNAEAVKAAQQAAEYRATSNYIPENQTVRASVENILRIGSESNAKQR